jgi:hypothetical protein
LIRGQSYFFDYRRHFSLPSFSPLSLLRCRLLFAASRVSPYASAARHFLRYHTADFSAHYAAAFADAMFSAISQRQR